MADGCQEIQRVAGHRNTMWIGSAPGEERVGSQTVQFLSKENESLDLREQRLEKL